MRIYTASKLSFSPKWLELEEAWEHDHHFHARWLKGHLGKTPDEETFAKVFWEHDLEDVRSADALLVYGRDEDHLRGALVEVGIAIASNIPVIVVGTHPDYGTWQYHRLIYRVANFSAAKQILDVMGMKPR